MDYFEMDWEGWSLENMGGKGAKFGFPDWALVFGVSLDALWCMLNRRIFYGKATSAVGICRMVLAKVQNYREALATASEIGRAHV